MTALSREHAKPVSDRAEYRSAAILNLCRKDLQSLIEANNSLYNFKINIGLIFGRKASGGKMLRGMDLGNYPIPNTYRNLGIKEYMIPRNGDITGESLENSETEEENRK